MPHRHHDQHQQHHDHHHHQQQQHLGYAQGVTDPELAAILDDIVGPDGAFRHRQHVNLTFLAVRRHGMPRAIDKVSEWIRQIAVYEQHPQKYHHTVSRAWVEMIAHHIHAEPACVEFDRFAQRHPALLDKRLLGRHYRSATLASPDARHGWIEPDAMAFPWTIGAENSGEQPGQIP
jgi:hypothetical protein